MTAGLTVLKAGLQTTLQAAPRRGFRHFGVPWSGPADPLSMALANRLVGRAPGATAIEMTLIGAKFRFEQATSFAVTGASATIKLNGYPVTPHCSHNAVAGQTLEIGACTNGCRVYLALAADIGGDTFLDSQSTYLPAALGGFEGRVLQDGDVLKLENPRCAETVETPRQLVPMFSDRCVLQVVEGPDFHQLTDGDAIFEKTYKVTPRASRMGVQMASDTPLSMKEDKGRKSAPVFPGTVQCPPDGAPFALLPDCQTTGGYPHILQVIRSDRFQLGQLRQNSVVRFVKRDPEYAIESYRVRWQHYSGWLSEPSI